jgi:hypothetical protein
VPAQLFLSKQSGAERGQLFKRESIRPGRRARRGFVSTFEGLSCMELSVRVVEKSCFISKIRMLDKENEDFSKSS